MYLVGKGISFAFSRFSSKNQTITKEMDNIIFKNLSLLLFLPTLTLLTDTRSRIILCLFSSSCLQHTKEKRENKQKWTSPQTPTQWQIDKGRRRHKKKMISRHLILTRWTKSKHTTWFKGTLSPSIVSFHSLYENVNKFILAVVFYALISLKICLFSSSCHQHRGETREQLQMTISPITNAMRSRREKRRQEKVI